MDSGIIELLSEKVQIKARIAANSMAIGKVHNEDMRFFRCKAISWSPSTLP